VPGRAQQADGNALRARLLLGLHFRMVCIEANTPRPAPRTNRTRLVPPPVLIGHAPRQVCIEARVSTLPPGLS
jgi:hypothetical protein